MLRTIVSASSSRLIQVRHLLPLSGYDPLQDLQHPLGTLPAWNTFSTTLMLGKTHEETGNLYHTGIGIHNYQSAGSDDGIQFSSQNQSQEADIQMLSRSDIHRKVLRSELP